MRPTTVRLDDQLCFALYAATNAVVRAYRPLLAELGITYPQYLTLMALWEQRRLTIGEIAERLDLPGHAVTPVVGRLVAAGLVTKRRDRLDRRSVVVELTAAGSALELGAAEAQHEVVCQTGLAPDDLADLRTRLHRLVDGMVDGELVPVLAASAAGDDAEQDEAAS